MLKKIKLENIVVRQKLHQHPIYPDYARYCPECGESVEEEVIIDEFICENCRHLVGENEKFCWSCGNPLETSLVVEHWHKGKKLPDEEFEKRKETIKTKVKGKER